MRNIIAGAIATALLAGAGGPGQAPPPATVRELIPRGQNVADRAAFEDFNRRVAAYLELRRAVAGRLPALIVTADVSRISQAVDTLAAALAQARRSARPGDLFTPAIAAAFRRVIQSGCGERGADLLAITHDEEDFAAAVLPPPILHGRWPAELPLTTMPPDLLAALPSLPPELEYRFMNRDLILRDVDANLIIDFMSGAIVASTSLP
jgi:hypothetical protein